MIIVKLAGGLGNQLFQYASGRALSLKFNTQLKLDIRFFEQPKYRKDFRLAKFNLPFQIAEESEYKKLCNLPGNKMIRRLKRMGIKFPPYYRNTHLIEDDIIKLVENKSSVLPSDFYIEGWLANEKYFKNYRQVLIDELNMDHAMSAENLNLREGIKSANAVSVHVRRGDYLTNSYFSNLTRDYYQQAFRWVYENINKPVFYFFSDDIDWVKKEYAFVDEAIFVQGNSLREGTFATHSAIDDLMLMRSCKHNIIANSTFSWWAAWLNTYAEKKVLFPARWFNDAKAQHKFETGNYNPATWIKINC